jgi:hypothetical protein
MWGYALRRTRLNEQKIMTNNEIINQFEISFYYWSLKDFKSSITQGYPLLKRIGNLVTNHLIEIIKSKPIEEQQLIAESLIKSQNCKALELLNIELTPINLYYASVMKAESTKFWFNEKYSTIKYNNSRLIFKSGKIINKAIEKEFESLTGTTITKCETGLLLTATYGKWQIKTGIDIPKKGRYFDYAHAIYFGSANDFNLIKSGISICSWLGFGMSKWEYLKDEDVIMAAKEFRQIYEHFINSFPEIVASI